jgi:hypothetical protein
MIATVGREPVIIRMPPAARRAAHLQPSSRMREQPRPRRRVSPTTLRLLRPLYRFSAARNAYVLRVAGGGFGPVLVDKTVAPPPAGDAPARRTGRFARATAAESSEPPVTRTRER